MNIVFGIVGPDSQSHFARQLTVAKSIFPSDLPLNIAKTPDQRACFAICQPAGFFPLERPFFNPRTDLLCMLHGYLWYRDHFPLTEETAIAQLTSAASDLADFGSVTLDSADGGLFTLYVFDSVHNRLTVASDYSGVLPCYYSLTDHGFFFSSHIRLLARQLESVADPIGVIQHSAFHHPIGKRTLFSNIFRLMPGESLSYDVNLNQLVLSQP